MLDKLHAETCTLKMRLVALGLPLSPPACIHQHKLKQMQSDFYEMACQLGYSGSDKLLFTAQYVFMQVTARHIVLNNIQDLSDGSQIVTQYMDHYFKSSSTR